MLSFHIFLFVNRLFVAKDRGLVLVNGCGQGVDCVSMKGDGLAG